MKVLSHSNEKKSNIVDDSNIEEGCVSIVAMLNKNSCGELVIGASKEGNIRGVSSASRHDLERIYEHIHNEINPKIFPSIFYEKELNIIRISFKGDTRPYSYKNKYYMRSYDENREMDFDSIMKEIRFLDPGKFYESCKSSEPIRNIDDLLIKDLNARAGIRNSRRTIKDTLQKYNLTRDNNLSLAGKNLFSKKTPLDIQINVYSDEKKRKIIKSTLIKGNIFELIEKANQLLIQEQTKDKSLKRIATDLITETMIFSFLNNSFNQKEQYVIQVSPFEISFRFPGTLFYMDNLEEYFSGEHNIINRNPIIGTLFDFANMTCNSKDCLDKIGRICKENSIIYSSFSTATNLTITYFRYSEKEKSATLEQAILSVLSTRPTIKADALAKKFNRTRRTIQTAIKKLKESNLIVRKGSNKNGYWIVNK